MHQAIAFAIACKFCRKLPFAKTFRNEEQTFAMSVAKSFALASEIFRNGQLNFAAFCLRFGGETSLANFRARQNSHSHSQLYRCDRSALGFESLAIWPSKGLANVRHSNQHSQSSKRSGQQRQPTDKRATALAATLDFTLLGRDSLQLLFCYSKSRDPCVRNQDPLSQNTVRAQRFFSRERKKGSLRNGSFRGTFESVP